MALLMIPCPTASTVLPRYPSPTYFRNLPARDFKSSMVSMSSGQTSSFKSGIYLPVNPPQSRSRSKGVVTTSFPCGPAIILHVSTDLLRSLDRNASIFSLLILSRSSRACLSPLSVRQPCVCPCIILFTLSTVSPWRTRYNFVIRMPV